MAKPKTPPPIAADPYRSDDPVVRRALILDDQRRTTLDLISGTSKWVRSKFRELELDLSSAHERSGAVDASDLIRQLACLQGLTHRLHQQNETMAVLYALATEWPDVEVTVPAYTEKKS